VEGLTTPLRRFRGSREKPDEVLWGGDFWERIGIFPLGPGTGDRNGTPPPKKKPGVGEKKNKPGGGGGESMAVLEGRGRKHWRTS